MATAASEQLNVGQVRAKLDQGRSPAGGSLGVEAMFDHVLPFAQNTADELAQRAGAFAVDDAYVKDSAYAAFIQIMVQETHDLAWLKSVKIEDAVDGNLDRFAAILLGILILDHWGGPPGNGSPPAWAEV